MGGVVFRTATIDRSILGSYGKKRRSTSTQRGASRRLYRWIVGWTRALGDKMIEKIKGLFHQYQDQILQWYDGLETLYQYGVLFLLIVIGFFLVSFLILSRITK